MKKIPIFKLEFEKNFINNFKKLSTKIFRSKSLSEGDFVNRFENKFSKFVKSKYAVSVSNGTTALELAFKAINIKGKEVIVPTNTFFATVISIINAGGVPVLCDNEKNSTDPDFEEIKKKINKKTKALCVVHVGGIISNNIDKIKKFCKKKKIFLIEDAAHAHGSNLDNIFNAGSIGDLGCFSFFPTKVMTTGEGGMITSNNLKLIKKIKEYKNFGRSKNPLILNSVGSNNKISEFTALMGLLELDRINYRINRRKKIVHRYIKNLRNNKNYSVIIQHKGKCSYYKCIIKTKKNSSMIKRICSKKNIELTGKVWEVPIHKQKVFRKFIKYEKFKNSDHFSKHHICPPNYPELSFKEVDFITSVLNKI